MRISLRAGAVALLCALAGCVNVPDYAFSDAEPEDADRRKPPDMGPLQPDMMVEVPPDAAAPDMMQGCVRMPEVCNGRDDDCDREVDEDFALDSDLDHCGGCGLACRTSNAEPVCIGGACRVERCADGFADIDGDPTNGCEYTCQGPVGSERCNGIDDDCDARIDEGIDDRVEDVPGVCLGTRIPCLPGGMSGEPDFTLRPGWQADESLCDGLDNDCDGLTDEAQPALGTPCAVGQGACLRAGVRVCAADGDGDRCDAEPGAAVPDMLCDGIDGDCDGLIDEGIAGCVRCDGSDSAPCNGCPEGTAVPAGSVCVPAGEFMLGSPDDEPGRLEREGPIHPVRITRGFLMQSTEVTRRAWRLRFDDDPSFFEFVARRPVEQINWYEAVAYANALSESEGRTPCYALDGCNDAPPGTGLVCVTVEFAGLRCDGYRLPTEAEWAYAARAGSESRYWFGDDAEGLRMTDYFQVNGEGVTHEVGQLSPNPWGLYDVHGNVWEWVHDGFAPFEDVLERDPLGPDDAEERVRRGGSFGSLAGEARSAVRDGGAPNSRAARGGFRLVRSLP